MSACTLMAESRSRSMNINVSRLGRQECHLWVIRIVSLRCPDHPFESFESFLYPQRDYRNESFGLSEWPVGGISLSFPDFT